MKKYLPPLRRSEFLSNTVTVFSGSFLSQLIPIFSAPFLARIYTPSNYGILAIYIGISGILGIIATFQYHNAILLPKLEEEAIALTRLSVRNAIISFAGSFLVLAIIGKPLLEFINAPKLYKWILLIPVSVFMYGLNSAFTALATRNKQFKVVSVNRILSAVITVSISVTLGLLYKSEMGLILGLIGGQIVNGIILGIRLLKILNIKLGDFFRYEGFRDIRRRYINFPKFSLPTDILNNFTNQLPVFMINAFAGQALTGLFNMCNRLLSMPQIFIASSFAEVFKQRASHDYHNKGTFRPIFLKTARTLAGFSLLPFLLILLFGPDIFAFFLGEKWRQSGEFARIMAPLFVLRFINSPLSYVLYLLGKLKFDLAMTIYLNVSTLLLLYCALTNLAVSTALMLYVLNYSLTYLFMIYKSFQFSKIENPDYEPV